MSVQGTANQLAHLRTVGARRIYLIEMQLYDTNTSSNDYQYFVSEPWHDNNVALGDVYQARLLGDLTLQQHFKEELVGGAQISAGSVDIENTDGAFDYWLDGDTSFAGRDMTIWLIDPDDSTQTGRGVYLKLFVGYTERFERIDNILMRVHFSQYGDTQNVDIFPHVVGTPTERYSIVHGVMDNLPARLVDQTKLKYASDPHRASIDEIQAVYVRGVAQTKGTEHSNQTNLDAATVTAGQFDYEVTDGHFRLGSNPDGLVTFDFVDGPWNNPQSSTSDIAIAVGQPGIVAGTRQPYVIFQSGAMTDLETTNGTSCGIYWNQETNINTALDQIFSGIGAVWWYDNEGKIQAERFEAPAVSEVGEINANLEILGDVTVTLLPRVWRVEYWHRRNWAPSRDFPSSITDSEAERFSAEWPQKQYAENSTILDAHSSAQIRIIKGTIDSAIAAFSEATRMLNLHKENRATYKLTVWGRPCAFGLNETWKLIHSRIAPSGKNLVVIGIEDNLLSMTTELTLWG